MTHSLVRGLLATALSLAAAWAGAQTYPTKPIAITVPFAAGGPTDVVARTLAEAMTRSLPGANVIVENVAGAGGTIGVTKVAKATPDGYSLLVHHIGMATAPALYRKLAFDPLKDFEYIGLINDVPMTLLVKTGFPAASVKELVPYLKANAAKVSFANAGLGSASHLCGLMFMSTIETDLTTVPYKGTAPAMTDLIGGQVDMLCDQTTNTTQQIKAGKVKALAVTSPRRLDTLKELPTMSESGLPGFSVSVWHALYAPKGTPKPVIDKLVAALQGAIKDPAVIKRHADLGAELVSVDRATPEALGKHLAAEVARWGPIIRKAGVYAD
ncbi:MAG: tripartite tricarboxylate transporter substrate binding protein BugD [Betaproteobacteria bacterium]|nr:tripartite tricarboxylate transporter substrate binding protein BugD [Betaproteobacteria bacterium]